MGKPTKVSIVGTEGTGKTVFLAVLANALTSGKSLPRITGENMRTRRYTAEVMDDLENGKWPPSTPVNVKRELKWCWYDRDGNSHELGTFDCAGQDFRAIFEAESDDVLSDKQRALQNEFHNCDLILLLLNLQDALDIYQKPGRSLARIDIEYAPSAAVRKLREAGITLYAVFTQSDRYDERIRREWNGNYSEALRDLLPDLYNALSETGSQFAVVRAVETEEVHGEVVPKKEKNAADLGDIIRAVDDFFAKRNEEERRIKLAAAEAVAREERRLREEEERVVKQAEDERRKKVESATREARKQKGLLLFAIFLLVAIAAGGTYGMVRYNAALEQERAERVAREERAMAEVEAQKRAEQERIRAEQEEAERKAREEKAAVEAEAQKRAERERIRAEQEEAERKAREEKAAAEAEAKKHAEQERIRAEQARIRAEQERALRIARERKAAADAAARIRAEQEAAERKAREERAAAELAKQMVKFVAFRISGINMDMQPIPPGSFLMGSSVGGEPSRGETLHSVTISKPYWLGKYPVTQGQWEAVMESNPSKFTRWFNSEQDVPVENVSWGDAMAFCRKLTDAERAAGRLPAGYRYTLPTEAEWEYACRAGTTGGFGGNENLEDMGWYSANSERKTHPIGQKQANAWGLYDMHGNVFEWCRDWFGPYPSWSITDPTGPASGAVRVVRGGGWASGPQRCRSAYRGGSASGTHARDIGFRVALAPFPVQTHK
jgi:formylglycine-generating enzyme required for sulfatase activity